MSFPGPFPALLIPVKRTKFNPHIPSATPKIDARMVTILANGKPLRDGITLHLSSRRAPVTQPLGGQHSQSRGATPLNQVHAVDQRLRLEEVDCEAPRQIASHKNA